MKQPIVVGVVGCGYWGPNLVRNFKGLPNCHLKAMCDVSESRLKHMKSLYSDVEGMTDFDHLAKRRGAGRGGRRGACQAPLLAGQGQSAGR